MNITMHVLLPALTVASCNAQDSAARATVDPRGAAQIAEYVVAAFEDSQGNLWFGTNGQGVARYAPPSALEPDGGLRYLSIEHGLIDDVVTDIAEDREGRLWFGTQAGASRYEPRAERKNGGTGFTGFGPDAGLRGAGCKLLVDRNGDLWAGTSAGAFRFDGARFVAFELPIPKIDTPSYKIVPGKVWDLCEDQHGNIWFARDGYGACKYDPSAALENGRAAFTLFTQADGLCSNNVADVVEDPLGAIWFGSITSDHPQHIGEGGLSRYDPSAPIESGKRALTQFPATKGLVANDIYNLYVDRSGTLWIGAVRVGAYRFDPRSASRTGAPTFTLYDKTDRPDLTQTFGVQAMLEDRHGTLWFGFSGGLFRFQDATFVNVTQAGPWSSPWTSAGASAGVPRTNPAGSTGR